MTLTEYLIDYASPKTKKLGEQLVKRELENIFSPKIKKRSEDYIRQMEHGSRDFRF